MKFPKKLDIQQRIKGWIGGCIHRQACKRGNTRPIISVENNSNKAGMGKGTYFLILLLDIIPRPRRSFPPRPGAGTETKPNYSSVSYYQLPPRHSMSDKTFSPVLRRPFPPPLPSLLPIYKVFRSLTGCHEPRTYSRSRPTSHPPYPLIFNNNFTRQTLPILLIYRLGNPSEKLPMRSSISPSPSLFVSPLRKSPIPQKRYLQPRNSSISIRLRIDRFKKR